METNIASIEQACTRLVYRYAELMDKGPASQGIELFSADPTLIHHTREAFTGREAIGRLFAAKQSGPRITLHVMSNVIITVLDHQHAKGSAIWTLYDANQDDAVLGEAMPMNGPIMVGRYADEFIKTEDGWLFAQRNISLVFKRHS